MKLQLLSIIAFVAIVSFAFGQELVPFFDQAKQSPLWRTLNHEDRAAGWKAVSSQDVHVAKWSIEDVRKYIQYRTHDINDRIAKTKEFEHTERAKIKGGASSNIAQVAKVFLESRSRFWKGTLIYPTALDFAAASRLIEVPDGRAELTHLMKAFDAAAILHSSCDEDQLKAYFIFAELCRGSATKMQEPSQIIKDASPVPSATPQPSPTKDGLGL